MSAFALVIYFSITAILMSACALALLRVNSVFADFLKKYTSSIAVVLAVVAIFAFLINDILVSLDPRALIAIVAIAVPAFAFVNHALSMCRRALFPRKKPSKKLTPETKKQHLALAGVYVIDLIGGLSAGFMIGSSFLVSIGSGIMTSLALSAFLIARNFTFVERYRTNLQMSGTKLKVVLLIPLLLVPLTAIIVFSVFSHLQGLATPLLSVVFSYLLYLAIWQFVFIVKAHKK